MKNTGKGYLIQDAYHYALAASGRESGIPVGPPHGIKSRTAALKASYAKAREAGLTVKRPVRLAQAALLIDQIREQSHALGINPYSGEGL